MPAKSKNDEELPTLVDKFTRPLLTSTARQLLASSAILSRLVNRAAMTGGPGTAAYDLTNCSDIDMGGLLLLMHAGKCLSREKWTAKVAGIGGTIDVVISNLNHLYLRHERKKDSSTGDYPLRNITDRNDMIDDLNEWWISVQEGTHATDAQVAMWQTQVAEVITNAFQHSGGDAALVAGQCKSKSVQLAAMDFGATIPQVIGTIARAADCGEGDGELIRYACRKEVTSRSVRENQGTGLFNLVQTVKVTDGRLVILSRNGLLSVSKRRTYCRTLEPDTGGRHRLGGTLVVVNLKIT